MSDFFDSYEISETLRDAFAAGSSQATVEAGLVANAPIPTTDGESYQMQTESRPPSSVDIILGLEPVVHYSFDELGDQYAETYSGSLLESTSLEGGFPAMSSTEGFNHSVEVFANATPEDIGLESPPQVAPASYLFWFSCDSPPSGDSRIIEAIGDSGEATPMTLKLAFDILSGGGVSVVVLDDGDNILRQVDSLESICDGGPHLVVYTDNLTDGRLFIDGVEIT